MNVITNNITNCNRALTALQNVLDPEIGLNIVDLGLIYQIDFDEASKKVFVCMTLTTQFCPMGSSIVDAVNRSIQMAFPGDEVMIDLTFNPPWNHERISVEGQKFLNE